MKCMHFVVILCVISLVVAERKKCKTFCKSESDCGDDQCCLKVLWIKLCVDKGWYVGAKCGGKFKCGSCTPPLQCVQSEKNFKSYFRIGSGKCLPTDFKLEPDAEPILEAHLKRSQLIPRVV